MYPTQLANYIFTWDDYNNSRFVKVPDEEIIGMPVGGVYYRTKENAVLVGYCGPTKFKYFIDLLNSLTQVEQELRKIA